MTKQYEIKYHNNTNCYDWYCGDEKIIDPHIIENALQTKDKEIQYWKHKIVSLLFILGRYTTTEKLQGLLKEIDNDGYELDNELFKGESDD